MPSPTFIVQIQPERFNGQPPVGWLAFALGSRPNLPWTQVPCPYCHEPLQLICNVEEIGRIVDTRPRGDALMDALVERMPDETLPLVCQPCGLSFFVRRDALVRGSAF